MIGARGVRIMLSMHKTMMAAMLSILVVTVTHPLEGLIQDTADRAAAVMAEARAALGGPAALDTVTALQATGDFRRAMGEMEMEGELQVVLAMPDKLRRQEDIIMPHGPVMTRIEVLNGGEVWDDSTTRGGMGHGPQIVLRGPGGNMDPERVKAMQLRMRRAEFARYALAWLLATDAAVTHAGVAQAPDGTADVLEISPAGAPAMRLFIDQKTHLPLMVSWRGPEPRIMVRRGPAPPQAAAEEPEREPQAEATFEMRLSDYRTVNGMKLPHLIARSVDGRGTEEWTITRYSVNPGLKSNTFTK